MKYPSLAEAFYYPIDKKRAESLMKRDKALEQQVADLLAALEEVMKFYPSLVYLADLPNDKHYQAVAAEEQAQQAIADVEGDK